VVRENVLRSFAARAIVPPGEPPGGIALRDAHDWEIVDRVIDDLELGELGKRRLESLTQILTSLGGTARAGDADAPSLG
jgi:ribosome biogenesis GTPase